MTSSINLISYIYIRVARKKKEKGGEIKGFSAGISNGYYWTIIIEVGIFKKNFTKFGGIVFYSFEFSTREKRRWIFEP